MSEWNAGVRAFTHVTVEANSPNEASQEALEKVDIPSGWDSNGTEPVLTDGTNEEEA